ncbi:fluoride efflux transporter CrcB [Marinimicrobium sp. C2-29]|uniref:fluoride efflux transporter CrcB n=1 Tax=Marinimicrobium sp. C2-29 TaxID=3139825 RepID=UPI003138A0FD
MQWLAVALGGALGAMGRFAFTTWLFPVLGPKFPLGTLVANLVGCFLIGLVYVLIVERGLLAPEFRPLVMTGFLGALTTFSTFSLDALLLWENGYPTMAVVYGLLTLVGCLLAVVAAVYLARVALAV